MTKQPKPVGSCKVPHNLALTHLSIASSCLTLLELASTCENKFIVGSLPLISAPLGFDFFDFPIV